MTTRTKVVALLTGGLLLSTAAATAAVTQTNNQSSTTTQVITQSSGGAVVIGGGSQTASNNSNTNTGNCEIVGGFSSAGCAVYQTTTSAAPLTLGARGTRTKKAESRKFATNGRIITLQGR